MARNGILTVNSMFKIIQDQLKNKSNEWSSNLKSIYRYHVLVPILSYGRFLALLNSYWGRYSSFVGQQLSKWQSRTKTWPKTVCLCNPLVHVYVMNGESIKKHIKFFNAAYLLNNNKLHYMYILNCTGFQYDICYKAILKECFCKSIHQMS